MTNKKNIARRAGLLYLIVILFGTFAELHVRAALVVPGHSQATVSNILNHQLSFRLAFLSDLLMQVAFFYLALTLYRLFESVNRRFALSMLLNVAIGVAIMCLNMLHHFAVILLLDEGGYLHAFSNEQLTGMVAFFLELHKYGYRIAQIFFGIWLFPLGYLVCQSGYFPKVLGIMLLVAGLSFLVDFFLFFLLTDYSAATSSLVTLPTVIGEFSLCVWLLIKGVKTVA
ncbi:DUF4386 domain-containing protein [Lewinella cohaerens]|uniref:DUF4386 domain-containing protein n=1 Tax=Lewinella cohaerens TaxID=70995 RepID=UPI0003A731E9|nr:DUF4386 domain-containing protein [Lewinella cohaerens]